MNKHAVVISRQWSGPLIKVDVTAQDIQISMSLAEFLQALAAEVGNPAFILTSDGLRQRLIGAAQRVTDGMKSETARVM